MGAPAQHTIEIVDPPESFEITNPGSESPDVTPQISWTESQYAEKYEVYLDGDLQGPTSAKSYTLPEQAEGTYTIEVRAINCAGTHSEFFTFTIVTPGPPPPENVNTVPKSIDVPRTVTWDPVSDAAWYQVRRTRVADSDVYVSPVVGTLYQEGLFQPGEYTFEVRSINSDDKAGEWSAPVTSIRPGVPTFNSGIRIANNAVFDVTPTLSWHPFEYAEAYDVELFETSDGQIDEGDEPVHAWYATTGLPVEVPGFYTEVLTVEVPAALPNGDYTVRVTGLNCAFGDPADVVRGETDTVSFTIERQPSVVHSWTLVHDTGGSNEDNITIDGRTVGQVTHYGEGEVWVEFDFDSDSVPDESVIANSTDGTFSKDFGQHRLIGHRSISAQARAKKIIPGLATIIQDDWTPISFELYDNRRPQISSVHLWIDTGVDITDRETQVPIFIGTLNDQDGVFNMVEIEVDVDEDLQPDTTYAPSSDGYLPQIDLSPYLEPFEPTTIRFRAVEWDRHDLVYDTKRWHERTVTWIPKNEVPFISVLAPVYPRFGPLGTLDPVVGIIMEDTTGAERDPYLDAANLDFTWTAGDVHDVPIEPNLAAPWTQIYDLKPHLEGDYGPVTVKVRPREYDSHRALEVYGEWAELTFTYHAPLPDVPVVTVLPKKTSNPQPIVVWTSDVNAVDYQIQFYRDGAFIGVTTTSENSTLPPFSLEPGNYTVDVWARNSTGACAHHIMELRHGRAVGVDRLSQWHNAVFHVRCSGLSGQRNRPVRPGVVRWFRRSNGLRERPLRSQTQHDASGSGRQRTAVPPCLLLDV